MPSLKGGVFIACAMLTPIAAAEPFTKIVDVGEAGFSSRQAYAVNDAGRVAFGAATTGGGGVYTGDGGPLTMIAPVPNCCASINSSGSIALLGSSGGVDGIFTGSGGPLVPVIAEGGALSDFQAPSINDAGTIAFVGRQNGVRALFRLVPGEELETVADASGPIQLFTGNVSLASDGTLAFRARMDDDEIALFRADPGGAVTLIADTAGPINTFAGTHSVNSAGVVAFAVGYNAGGGAILLSDGANVETIIDTNGPIDSPGSPNIMDSGDVVFAARLDSGQSGIFTGPHVVRDKIIADGDGIFGETATSIRFGPDLASETGIVAFEYDYAGGFGIATVNVADVLPACGGDVDLDGTVDFDDLNLVLGAWGKAYGDVGYILEADLDADLLISFDDLNAVLTAWGCVE